MDVIVAVASNDFGRRAGIGDGTHVLDGIAAGLNMLAEECGRQRDLERHYRERIRRVEHLAAVGQVAAGVAHEINNPAAYVVANLTAIARQLDQRTDDRAAAELRPLVADALEGIERITAIAGDLRNMARPEPARLAPIDVNEAVVDAYQIVRPQIVSRARFERALGEVPAVEADRLRLTQVVTNLFANAVEATPDGEASEHRIRVETSAGGGRVKIRVSDTGHGMTPEVRQRIFEPFFTTKSTGGSAGLGLGLAISLDLVREIGGDLVVESVPGCGTTMTVDLPAAERRAEPAGASPGASDARPRASRRPRLLAIDDEPRLLRACRRMLGETFALTVAGHGEAAKALVTYDQRWDYILCDVIMPGTDGPAFLEWLKTHYPALVDRLWFCSGGSVSARTRALRESMPDRWIGKPFTPAQLLARLGLHGR
jgi:signal transduction histidine kinase